MTTELDTKRLQLQARNDRSRALVITRQANRECELSTQLSRS